MNAAAREARFWARLPTKSVPDGSCRMWTRGLDQDGYAVVYYNGRSQHASRVVLARKLGRPLVGLALHTCDRPACVADDHLYEGTPQNNMDDAFRRGRKNDRGSRNGHAKLSEGDVIAMRAARASGVKLKTLASQYRLNVNHVWDIVTRKGWTHV